MHNNQNSIPPALLKRAGILGACAAAIIVALFFIVPWYRSRKTQRPGRNRARQRCSRSHPHRKRKHHTHLHPIPLGAPAVRPQRQNSNLHTHRNQPPHPRIHPNALRAKRPQIIPSDPITTRSCARKATAPGAFTMPPLPLHSYLYIFKKTF